MRVDSDSDLTNQMAKNAMNYIDELNTEVMGFKEPKKDLEAVAKKNKKNLNIVTKERDNGKREEIRLQAERDQLMRERDELKKWKQNIKDNHEAVKKGRTDVNDLMKK